MERRMIKLFLAGFLMGILVPNVIWKTGWNQRTAASVYLLGAFAGKASESVEYMQQVLRMRGSWFLVIAFCGISVFGVPAAVFGCVLAGVEVGLLLTMSILQFGLSGGAVGAALLLPQYLLYLPAGCYLLADVYRESMRLWRNHGLLPKNLYRYGLRVGLAGLVYLGGIFLEVFCNPWVVEKIIGGLKIF